MPKETLVAHREVIQLTLGTLAAKDAISTPSLTTMDRPGRIVTQRMIGALIVADATLASSVFLGVCDAYLSDTEVEESLEGRPVAPRDRTETKKTSRYARIMSHPASASGIAYDAGLVTPFNSGWQKVLLAFEEDQVLYRIWAYNFDPDNALTSTNLINIFVESLLRFEA